jgi:hypothetical protein
VPENSLPHAVLNQKYPVHQLANHFPNTSHKYLTILKGFLISELQRGKLLNKKGEENILTKNFFQNSLTHVGVYQAHTQTGGWFR